MMETGGVASNDRFCTKHVSKMSSGVRSPNKEKLTWGIAIRVQFYKGCKFESHCETRKKKEIHFSIDMLTNNILIFHSQSLNKKVQHHQCCSTFKNVGKWGTVISIFLFVRFHLQATGRSGCTIWESFGAWSHAGWGWMDQVFIVPLAVLVHTQVIFSSCIRFIIVINKENICTTYTNLKPSWQTSSNLLSVENCPLTNLTKSGLSLVNDNPKNNPEKLLCTVRLIIVPVNVLS